MTIPIRLTYDYGIDLGTTNSEIACFSEGESLRIFKNTTYQTDFTPSAVWIDKKGSTRVGQDAKDEHFKSSSDKNDAYIEFKKKMGEKYTYHFVSSGKTMLPEELSAEVLKSLKRDVERLNGEKVSAAIITVPAVFGLPECKATEKAAKLAGIDQVSLVLEPVAATYAYGLDKVGKKEVIWMVYDLGGGTFDVALVSNKEGRLRVLSHDGDRELGGKNFDWDLVYKIAVPRIQEEHHLKDLNPEDKKYGIAFAKLKGEAERVKIRLSQEEPTSFHIPDFCSELGQKIEVDFEITPGELEKIVSPYIERTIGMCKKILKEAGLEPTAVEKLILVGGPTLMPFVRRQLQEKLGIQIEFGHDPITVVAEGAAIVAHTLRREEKPVEDFEGYEIKPFEVPETTLNTEPFIGGKILSFKKNNPPSIGSTIEIANKDGSWASGKIQVNEDGIFSTNIYIRKDPARNEFSIELYNPSGEKMEVTPARFIVTYEAPRETMLINSVGLHLANGSFKKYIEKGATLPTRKMYEHKTTIPLVKGSQGEVLNIPVCEGEQPQADLNRLIGILKIPAEKIKRDLDMGSKVEVTIEIDKSRLVTTRAYITALDQEFEEPMDIVKKEIEIKLLEFEFNKLKERLKQVKSLNDEIADSEAGEIIRGMDKEDRISEVERNIKAAKGGVDKDAGERAHSGVLVIKERIGRTESLLTWPRLERDAKKELESVDRCFQDSNITEYITDADRKEFDALKKEISAGLREKKDKDAVETLIGQISALRIIVLLRIPGIVVSWFQEASDQYNENPNKYSNSTEAERLIKEGAALIPSVSYGQNSANISRLREIVVQLWRLGFNPGTGKYGSHVE